MTRLLTRAAAVPPFTLGFLLLCLLQADLDRVDPSSGAVERLLGLLLVAYGVAGVVVALAREPEPPGAGSALGGDLVRGGLVVAAVVLVVQVLAGARLNPVVDVLFVVSVLLLATTTLPWPTGPGTASRLLRRWAVPSGLTAVVLGVPLVAYRVATLA